MCDVRILAYAFDIKGLYIKTGLLLTQIRLYVVQYIEFCEWWGHDKQTHTKHIQNTDTDLYTYIPFRPRTATFNNLRREMYPGFMRHFLSLMIALTWKEQALLKPF